VPAPEGSSAANYARHFVGQIFFRTFEPLGIKPEFYWVSELYAAGRMDRYIKQALDRADRVRDIYQRVSHVERSSNWLPIQVICESCGRIGTTYATDWDGSTVAYACKPDMVAWAKGCGHEGRVSPLGGAAKLPWNLEWAAKWGLLGVTIEG
jgi:lysyl-tRNA synthetase class 1